MLPLITTALGALLWLLHASLGQDPAAMAGGFPWTWIKPLAMGVTALAVGQVLRRLLVAALRGSSRLQVGSGSELLQSVLTIVLYAVVGMGFFSWGLGLDLGNALTTSALVSAIIGLALQPTLGHLFSGVSIEIERPLRRGDFVRRNELEGEVIALNWRSVNLRTDRGSMIVMPNSEFTNQSLEVIPADQPFRHTVQFSVQAHEPPGLVIRTAMRVLQSGLTDVCESPAPSVVVLSHDPATGTLRYGARLYTTRFLNRSSIASDFLERLWYALSRQGVGMLPSTEALWTLLGDRAVAKGVPPAAPVVLPPRLKAVGDGLSGALLLHAAVHRYGRDERCDEAGVALLIEGQVRETRWTWESDANAELEQIVLALAAPTGLAGGPIGLQQTHFDALLRHGTSVLGPVARQLCERIGTLTEDPWLAWHAFGRQIADSDQRTDFLAHAPNETVRALHEGDWLGWHAALGIEHAPHERRARGHCTFLAWDANTLRRLVREAAADDQDRLLEYLRLHADGCQSLDNARFEAWLHA